MAIKLKKSYKFAFRSALIITLLLAGFIAMYMMAKELHDWLFSFFFVLAIFFISFFVIQLRVEKFIYKRVKKNL